MQSLDFRDHLENLIKALIALSPSRNLITQFFMMLPDTYVNLLSYFPQLMNNLQFLEIIKRMGVNENKRAYFQLEENKFAFNLVEFILTIFKLFEDEEAKRYITKLMRKTEQLLSPFQEWKELSIRHISKRFCGKEILKLLRDLMKKEKFEAIPEGTQIKETVWNISIQRSELETFLKEREESLGKYVVDEFRKLFLIYNNYGLIENKEYEIKGRYKLSLISFILRVWSTKGHEYTNGWSTKIGPPTEISRGSIIYFVKKDSLLEKLLEELLVGED